MENLAWGIAPGIAAAAVAYQMDTVAPSDEPIWSRGLWGSIRCMGWGMVILMIDGLVNLNMLYADPPLFPDLADFQRNQLFTRAAITSFLVGGAIGACARFEKQEVSI